MPGSAQASSRAVSGPRTARRSCGRASVARLTASPRTASSPTARAGSSAAPSAGAAARAKPKPVAACVAAPTPSPAAANAIAAPSAIQPAVGGVGAEPLRLAGHDLAHRRAAGDAVDGAGEVELALDLPQLVVAVGREQLRRVAGRDPADRHDGPGCQPRGDVQDAVDAQLAAGPGHRMREQRGAGGDEDLVLHAGAVDV